MTYSIRFGPNLSPIPLTPNAELYTMHHGLLREEIAKLYLPHSLVALLREWAVAWNDNYIAFGDQRYVDDELEAVLKRLFEKLGPLVRKHLPAWIDLEMKYEM